MNKKLHDEPVKNDIEDCTKRLKNRIRELEKEIETLENYRKYEEAANETKAIMDAFVSAGFTESQAFTLLTKMFVASMGGK